MSSNNHGKKICLQTVEQTEPRMGARQEVRLSPSGAVPMRRRQSKSSEGKVNIIGGVTESTAVGLSRRHANSSENLKLPIPKCCFSFANGSGNQNCHQSGHYAGTTDGSKVCCCTDIDLEVASHRFQAIPKDKSLLLALEDVHKLHDEFERLMQSYDWQANKADASEETCIETLRNVYVTERKKVQETQHLQGEYIRMYERCYNLQRELAHQREMVSATEKPAHPTSVESEIAQQNLLLQEQHHLIHILNGQKRVMIEHLQSLNSSKNKKVELLQRTIDSINVENKRMANECTTLKKSQKYLKEDLMLAEIDLEIGNSENAHLTQIIFDLTKQLDEQDTVLKFKEDEIKNLKTEFKINLQGETDADKIHSLCLNYHDEICAKNDDIVTLKNSQAQLQEELNSLNDLQSQNSQQSQLIDELNAAMEVLQSELIDLRQSDANKEQMIGELQRNLKRTQDEHLTVVTELLATKSTLKKTETKLVSLNEQFTVAHEDANAGRIDANLETNDNTKCAESENRESENSNTSYEDCLGTEVSSSSENDVVPTDAYMEEINSLKIDSNPFYDIDNMRLNMCALELLNLEKFEEMYHMYGLDMDRVAQLYCRFHGDFLIQIADKSKLDYNNALEIGVPVDDMDSNVNHSMEKLLADEQRAVNLQRAFETWRSEETVDEEIPEKIEAGTQSDDDVALTTNLNNSYERISHIKLIQLRLTETLLNMEAIVRDNHVLVSQLSQLKRQQRAMELQKKLNAKSDECRNTKLMLVQQTQIIDSLNQGLLENDEMLYKVNRAHERLQVEQINCLDKLKKDHDRLVSELRRAKEVEGDLTYKLLRENKIVLDLRQRLYNTEAFLRNIDRTAIENSAREQEMKIIKQQLDKIAEPLYHSTNILHYVRGQPLVKVDIQSEFLKNTSIWSPNAISAYTTWPKKPLINVYTQTEIAGVWPCSEEQRVFVLNDNINNMQQRLDNSMQVEARARETRIKLIGHLLDQQNEKIYQLTVSQSDWRELLNTIKSAQKIEDRARRELELKRQELKTLSFLFNEQSEELNKVLEYSFIKESRMTEENATLKAIFEVQLKLMTDKLFETIRANERQKYVIKELKHKYNNYNKQEIDHLKSEMARLLQERDAYVERLHKMENEIIILRETKPETAKASSDIFKNCHSDVEACSDDETSNNVQSNTNTPNTNDSINSSNNNSINNNNSTISQNSATIDQESDSVSFYSAESTGLSSSGSDYQSIQSKMLHVPNTEYKLRMNRYDLHIRTLLNSVRSLRKALKSSKNHAVTLQKEKAEAELKLKNYKAVTTKLEELCIRFEGSQAAIKVLERKLEKERKKFENSSLAKSHEQSSLVEQINELMGNYDKLLQRSALHARRLKTSAIFDLMERSNQCIPDVSRLTTSINLLRSDITDFVGNYSIEATTARIPTLQDELLAAARNN